MQYEKSNKSIRYVCTYNSSRFSGDVDSVQAFEELTQTQMRLLLAAECALCAIIYSAVFLSKEAKKQKELRNARLKERHEERVSLRAEEMRGIDFDGGFDIAA